MVYCTDTPRTASPSRPKSPPVIAKVAAPVAPSRRPITKTVDAPKVIAKPKKSDWRDATQASYRRNEALAAAYRAAGNAWGDENPYAATGEIYGEMMRAYGEKVAPLCAKQEGGERPSLGENYASIMQRYDGAKGALRSQRDPAAERKSIDAAKRFHEDQLARNRRFAASLKAAADAQWGRK